MKNKEEPSANSQRGNASGQVDLSIIAGQIRVLDGELVGVALPALVSRQNELAADLVARTEKRYGVRLSHQDWRRAFV